MSQGSKEDRALMTGRILYEALPFDQEQNWTAHECSKILLGQVERDYCKGGSWIEIPEALWDVLQF